MKIKTKKQFTLPQLIEWGFENGVHGAQFKSNRGKRVGFRHMGHFWTEYEIVKDELFTIEAEEEITEETAFDHIVEINTHGEHLMWSNSKIANIIDYESEEFHAYINGEFKLIWRDGKLVE